MTEHELGEWFVHEVLPLEAMLEGFLRRNWRVADEVADLRQEVYARVYAACSKGLPDSAQAFAMSTARNLLIDRARRAQIVSIEAYADVETLSLFAEERTPERHASARSELRVLQAALDTLPSRCREVVRLRKIEGLSQREVAATMGITEDTVERQVSKGVRALAAALGQSAMGGPVRSTGWFRRANKKSS